ncbi:hypothetical protein MKX03_009059 [Papaver bracteatum]|nr:hypothetical protein MKX03_009059 [Papaver bracteatum]
MQKSVHRSINRANHFKKLSSSTYSSMSSNHDDDTISTSLSAIGIEFVMNISLGTPPLNVFAIADTGSDLTWVQCKPCENCYKQDSPLFDPKTSSTYKDDRYTCENTLCQYLVRYGDGSYSNGNLAFETLTFDSTSGRSIQLPNIAFGCGHNTARGNFNEKGSGLIGLGGGVLSLISQLGSKIDSKFSYCLVPSHDVSSKFIFGSNAEMTGKDVLSTPLLSNPFEKTFYYLALEAISVNENKVPFISNTSSTKDTEAFQEDNYIIIDSGTTFTFLPEEMYLEIESEIKKAIQVEPIVGPNEFSLCYPFDDSMTFPKVTELFCFCWRGCYLLSFFPSSETPYLYGNVAQINFLVEYALKEKKVSFKPTDCTKQGLIN